MDVAIMIAKAREVYHANMTSVINAANQLKLIKDEKADELNKRHVMTLINDVWPRIYGEEAIAKLLEE